MPETRILSYFSEVGLHINTCIKIYEAAQNTDCFHDIKNPLPRLMHIQQSIASASKDLDVDSAFGASHATLKDVLKKCIERAKSLHAIFNSMASPTGASELKKNIKKMRTASQATKVDELINDIMQGLQAVSEIETSEADEKMNTQALAKDNCTKKSDKKDKGGDGSAPSQASGPRKEYIYNGTGDQNIANDNAAQLTGAISGGTFNFNR